MAEKVDKRPNFLVIVADDLGFSDCSCFGSEIQTPNIDALAKASGSLRYTNFHVAAACSPTRSMLMTGTDHHIAGLGQLQEITRQSPAHAGAPGHEGYLNERVVAIPELLSDGGYLTLMSGKWHLGVKPEHRPGAKGFQKSFALIPGCANHYAYEPSYKDPKAEPHRFFETAARALHVEDDRYAPDVPAGWYSSDGYSDKLMSYLDGRTPEEKEKPFFAYLPYTAPHYPLQAPKEYCDKYRGFYDDGPEALRQKRLARLKELGLIEQGATAHNIVISDGQPEDWHSLPDHVREASSRAMEVYAGMVERMDWNIGRVVDHLKKTGEHDNTMILFMSDNGAEGASYEALPLVGPDIMAHVHDYYDNSLENIGRANSFVWYGCRWAQAATAPGRLFKMHSTEGGCRVPLVVKPARPGSPANGSSPEGGVVTDAFCSVMDIVPTILDLSNIPQPGPLYKGRQIAPLLGRSWVPFMNLINSSAWTRDTLIHGPEHVMGFEINGSGALRRGDWKITFVPKPRGPQRWELFNIKQDAGETRDLSEEMPDKLEQMLKLWDEYKESCGVIGVAGEYPPMVGPSEPLPIDPMDDPYAWIKYIGRPEITPVDMQTVVPTW